MLQRYTKEGPGSGSGEGLKPTKPISKSIIQIKGATITEKL